MSLPLPQLLLIGFVVFLALLLALRIGFAFIMKWVARRFLSAVGNQALAKQPDTLELKRDPSVQAGGSKTGRLAQPLLAAGFHDCGVWISDKTPGVRIRFLIHERTYVAAFVYEHPRKPEPWIELSVRYEDGTTTALSTLPPTGIDLEAPFYRKLRGDPLDSSDRLYQRLLRERSAFGVKPVTRDTVVPEFEKAYTKIMLWKKARGISPEEAAAVGKLRLARRRGTPPA